MNNKLKVLVSVIAMSFVMVGCGSSGSSSGSSTPPVDPMSERQIISISLHYPAEVCEDAYVKSDFEAKGYTNVMLRVENNSVTCATYNKVEGVTSTGSCKVQDMVIAIGSSYSQYDTSCVLGFDLGTNTQVATTQEDMTLNMSSTLDAIIATVE